MPGGPVPAGPPNGDPGPRLRRRGIRKPVPCAERRGGRDRPVRCASGPVRAAQSPLAAGPLPLAERAGHAGAKSSASPPTTTRRSRTCPPAGSVPCWRRRRTGRGCSAGCRGSGTGPAAAAFGEVYRDLPRRMDVLFGAPMPTSPPGSRLGQRRAIGAERHRMDSSGEREAGEQALGFARGLRRLLGRDAAVEEFPFQGRSAPARHPQTTSGQPWQAASRGTGRRIIVGPDPSSARDPPFGPGQALLYATRVDASCR